MNASYSAHTSRSVRGCDEALDRLAVMSDKLKEFSAEANHFDGIGTFA